jgi:hypothetical protein
MRSWFVIPAMGGACGGAAVALGGSPVLGLAGAAIAAVIRVLAGDSPAALSGAMLAPLLAVATWADTRAGLVRAAIALAAAGWTITELARSPDGRTTLGTQPTANDNAPPTTLSIPYSPWFAVLPASLAALLAPSCAPLIAIAGARLVTAPGRRSRWALAVPTVGALACLLAVLGATTWRGLGALWFPAAHPTPLFTVAERAGELLGPLTAVAALAGLASLTRARLAELALAACVAGALLVDIRAGTPGPVTVGLAALLAGLAVGRLAALIRLPAGQAITGAVCGLLVMFPPAWTAIDAATTEPASVPTSKDRPLADAQHAPPAAHSGQASR